MRLINWSKIARFACRRLAEQHQKPIDSFYELRSLAEILQPNYRLQWPNLDWWKDQQFNQYLSDFGELTGMNSDRRWMLHELLRAVATVPGDTAECGVFQGASSYQICRANALCSAGGKTHHLFDSFEGVSQPNGFDGDHWTAGDLTCPLEVAKRKLQAFPDTMFWPGWIPSRFAEVAERRFSFVHIDVDLYEPTRDSIEFFYPRLVDGGILVCDDYGFSTCPGATRAVDEFLANQREFFLRMSAGGGFLIKGVTVATALRETQAA